jgi:hypothetical protein
MARLEQGKFCPLIKKECIGIKCSWFTQVRGSDPQSDREIDEYACAIAWLPVLLINTAKETREGAAATESLRNEMATMAEATIKAVSITSLMVLGKPPTIKLKDGS